MFMVIFVSIRYLGGCVGEYFFGMKIFVYTLEGNFVGG